MDTTPFPSAVDRDDLAARHLPLVAHLVRETMTRVPSAVDRHDLHAAGLLALLAAARDFDPARPASFADHASIRVRGALVDELRSVDWAARVACPRDPEVARARLESVLARFADSVAVASALGLTAGPGPLAAVRPRAEREPRGWADRVQCVALAVEELPSRLRHVARGYFIDQRPMAELAAELGASEARSTQLRDEALVLLRDALATTMNAEGGEPAAVGGVEAHDRSRAATRALAAQHAARRSPTTPSREQLETSA